MTDVMAAYAATGLAFGGATLSALAWRASRARELAAQGSEDPRLLSVWRAGVRPLARLMIPKSPAEAQPMVSRLQQAGRSGEAELPFFLEEKVGLLLAGVLCGLAAFFALGYPWGALLAAAFAVVGLPYNLYWGLMTAPMLCFGPVRAPRTLLDLWRAARPTPGETPCLS